MTFSGHRLVQFQKKVYDYYSLHRRKMPWREILSPYSIFISEVMLQQTQVERVISKYKVFLHVFPSFKSLAAAPLRDILSLWSGLGYNRRAVWLHRSAKIIVNKYQGKLPADQATLQMLPGIGPHTAGSIIAFAYNKPVVFIETNIRSALLHDFYKNKDNVHDKELMSLIEITLDKDNPRTWYWALMDYGSYIKKKFSNPSRRSKHHIQQKAFHGSNRQLRGRILKNLLQKVKLTKDDLIVLCDVHPSKLQNNLKDLQREGLISRDGDTYSIPQ
ncbi:hypothetical protein A3H80_02635 [Candidatus Roizmanbacteria bacterium RIFCSPLOWO2_02_FULL_37_19]|uniref:HhH-GPD domain-containing protein n=1 Tax=Candidatus Roizmanbacteria bacterium RIFCSPHIGHO2_02_FULL_37_24 TaxID=1802037 RepID=A0A1F7H0N6_9BACT|nr:MAG: hypothetical protein A2862_02340 [Candidatus Roizmanbacteria bacterium RIFCSPHIGHO2_01_FULL_38_41]OGK24819.1 MAG: hypothetical protein A3C24_00790 [Candidatus Roizmanbacteria bacterium RIFCSPHIGHO2_02_FULL_37_24]OGK32783.1 MAG: hypothetical protein A3E10_03245 [Candidatus Roizmanbacteria bacterium RIFCSPHIGHO2_12_FULL_37_23]OGK45591.1 MAG: hypothetical protein A2956_02785 [Candidatus Roizmanbacteria bacterium RIFCSPLOWO2_01_FULL_37_57]OGK53635.1 MAG: hypothetical protein A3H80_02635 [Ca